jgi:hypothetical protein
MKEFTKKIKDRGWKLKDLATRWDLSLRRLNQIADDPQPLHLDAVAGLPSNLPGNVDFDDFAEIVAGKSSHDLAVLIMVATKKYGWSDEQTKNLLEDMTDLLDFAEFSRLVRAGRV